MDEIPEEDDDILNEMESFIRILEASYGVKIYPYSEATKEDKEIGFKVVTDVLPFYAGPDTNFIILLPPIIFEPGPDNRAFFLCGSEKVITDIIDKLEFNSKVPKAERLKSSSGLISKEDFDKMWGTE